MNNFNYLLLIILLIILLFYIYINCNIEYFQQLPKADLGPIKFVDADNTDEVLGKFPPDWDENELYRPENNLEPTIIKIKRGPKGFKGKGGSGGLPGKCEGNINISSINGDKLEINTSKLNISAFLNRFLRWGNASPVLLHTFKIFLGSYFNL